MKSAIVGLLVCFVATVVHGAAIKACNSTIAEADKHVAGILLLGDRNAVFVSTEERMDTYCSDVKGHLASLAEYGPCLKPFARQVFSLVYRELKKENKRRCTVKHERDEFIKMGSCLTSMGPEKREHAHLFVDYASQMLTYISENVELNDQIPSLCCTLQVMKPYIATKVKQADCKEASEDEIVTFILAMIENVLGEANDLVCSKFDSLAVCKDKLPKITEQLQEMESSVVPQGSSILKPMFALIEKATF